MRELRDKVAVVTGAGSGIGRALARRLAREGCNLVLADISPDALADVDAELVEAGTRTAAIEADVTDQDSVDALAEAALTAFGAVHVVCNNAGVGVPRGGGMYVWDTPLPEYEWVMRTNVWGIIHGCRAFVPILLAQGEPAHIVNTVSVAGLLARAATHVYTMSKHAALSLSESLVAQLAEIDSSIGVSLLCPGYVDTGLSASDTSAPPAVAALAEAETAEHAEMRARFERSIGRGIAPDLVAAGAIDAILTGRTYVLTHPEYNELIRLRVADIMERGTLEQYGEAYRSFARRQGAKEE